MFQKSGLSSARKWVFEDYDYLRERYKQAYYDPIDYDEIDYWCWENPIQARMLLQDFNLTNERKIDILLASIFSGDIGKLIFIIAKKGGGKNALAFYIAEELHRRNPNQKICFVGRRFDTGALPEWCSWNEKIQDVANGTFIIIDELGINASARDSMSDYNKQITSIFILARQKKQPCLVLAQDAKLGEINTWRLKDILLWKKSNSYSMEGRKETEGKAGQFYSKIRNKMAPKEIDEVLYEFPAEKRFLLIRVPLPDCWNDRLSNLYSSFSLENKQKNDERVIDKAGFIKKKPIIMNNRIIIGGKH